MNTKTSESSGLPNFKPEDLAAMKDYWNLYDADREAISKEILAVIAEIPTWATMLKSIPPEQMAEQEKKSRELQRLAMVEGKWAPYSEDLRTQGTTYARAGISFGAWLPLFTAFRSAMRPRILKVMKEDPARSDRIFQGMNLFLDRAVGLLGEAYVEAKEGIIAKQQQAIREISTPVLQVREHLLILPVVGMVDTQRARHLTTALLENIRDRRARAVVMDITGVPIVDSKVANHLAQACEAARLMGARVILTGISPEIAQALVAIGADLSTVRTVADLQGGIEEAETALGYEVKRPGFAAAEH